MRSAAVIAVLVAGIAGCSRGEEPPTPPPSPGLAVLARPAPPPPSDGFAQSTFSQPLSIQDAEAILRRRTPVFAFGTQPPRRQVQAFNVVFEQPDAAARFRVIAESGSAAGRLYALAGLLMLDRAAANRVTSALGADAQVVRVFDSDTAYEKPVRDVAMMIEDQNMGESFRRVRDETNACFARQR